MEIYNIPMEIEVALAVVFSASIVFTIMFFYYRKNFNSMPKILITGSGIGKHYVHKGFLSSVLGRPCKINAFEDKHVRSYLDIGFAKLPIVECSPSCPEALQGGDYRAVVFVLDASAPIKDQAAMLESIESQYGSANTLLVCACERPDKNCIERVRSEFERAMILDTKDKDGLDEIMAEILSRINS